MAALAFGVWMAASRHRRQVDVAVGRSAVTSSGRVTVHGWKPAKDADSLSEADVESCRVVPDGPIVDLSGFRLKLPGGRQLEPKGSRFAYAEKAQCVRATVLFDAQGARPSAVVFRSGSTDFTWKVPAA